LLAGGGFATLWKHSRRSLSVIRSLTNDSLENQLRFIFTLVLLAASGLANSAVKTYDISWSGARGFSLEGQFSYDAATAGDTVTFDDLLSLSLEGFRWGVSIGSSSGAAFAPNDGVGQFNFSTATESFLLGGVECCGENPVSLPSQKWFIDSNANGIGFSSGTAYQGLYQYGGGYSGLNGYIDDSLTITGNSTLTATLAAVPIPAAVWLFGSALAGLGWVRRKPTV